MLTELLTEKEKTIARQDRDIGRLKQKLEESESYFEPKKGRKPTRE
jgi:uncharacterized coiled-coil protein SlyX